MSADFEDALFQSIATLIHEQRRNTAMDRRKNERHAYPCIQLVAPYDGEHLPEQADFERVRCHDLSPKGFAFLTDKRPTQRQVIVALGQVPFKFLVAEIVRTSLEEGYNGERHLQVGCRFVRRIS